MTADPAGDRRPRVLVVGSGWRFTSGISYYTCCLTNALAARSDVTALLTRHLVPRLAYPGRRRVGRPVNEVGYRVEALECLDWFWGTGMLRARARLRETAPDVVILQWWTGAVLHTYLALARAARARGALVLMEWHEVQDTGEARIPGVRRYTSALMRRLLALVDGHLVHSAHDVRELRAAYDLRGPVRVAPHGPYQHVRTAGEPADAGPSAPRPGRERSDAAAPQPTTVLYFGVVRPYKGVEDLVAAFDALPEEIARDLRLLVVGETWEGWTAHRDAIARSPRRDRIVVRDEYVTDAEVRDLFAQADVVALPYRRSSSSGPLSLAMSAGLPVLVTDVGGLRAATDGYAGAVFARSGDVPDLARGLQQVLALAGRRFDDRRSWDDTVDAVEALIEDVRGPRRSTPTPTPTPTPDRATAGSRG